MIPAQPETFFERHSWKALIAMSSIFAIFGIGDMLQGMSADPAIANSITGVAWEDLKRSSPAVASLINLQVRSGGAQLVLLALLSIFICLRGYRRGERWAWYAMWAWPVLMVFIFLAFITTDKRPESPLPPPMISAPIFFVIFVLALLLPYRKFFPAKS